MTSRAAEPETFDALILGAGQAGVPLASSLAGSGKKVGLVEVKHIGGTCVNVGCTPTKTMIASARAAHLARRSSDFGVEVGTVTVDQRVVRQRKRDIVESFRKGSRTRLEKTEGLELLFGEAAFTGPHEITVASDGGGRRLRAELIFINTGARPRAIELPGLEGVSALTSETIMELGETPNHLLIIGGGYVGVEFAQMFRRFGSQVTIVQRSSQLLPNEDEDLAEALAEVFAEDGIDVLLNCKPSSVSTRGQEIRLEVACDSGPDVVTGSHLLIAAGRVPNTESLNLEDAGIDTDESGYVAVDDRLQTNVQGVYALGDVNGGPAFTHVSYDDFRIVRDNLLGEGSSSTRDRVLPYTVFTDPQLGRVGLSERDAAAANRQVKVAKMPMSRVARAQETDETRGFMKALVDPADGRIVGAAVLGVEGGEIAAAIQIAMLGKLPYTALRDAPIAHPTFAESLNNLFAALD